MLNFLRKNKDTSLFFVVVLVLGFFLRFDEILWKRDFWYDEAFTGILLNASWSNMMSMIYADVHPPLYYILAKMWTFLFSTSALGIRSFSLFFGFLTIPSVFFISYKLFNNRNIALLAMAITAISPFAIEYSQEARMYAMFGFLFLWGSYYFLKALRFNSRKDWILWGVFCGLSFLTHYLSLFFFCMFYLSFVFYRFFIKKDDFLKAISAFNQRYFYLGVFFILLFFLTWIKIFIIHISKGNLGWIPPTQLSVFPETLQIFFFGHFPGAGGVPSSNEFIHLKGAVDMAIFDGSSVGLFLLFFLVIMFTVAWIKNKNKNNFLVLAMLSFGTLFFLIFLSYFNLKLYVARYFMPAAVLIYILFAGLMVSIFPSKSSIYKVLIVYSFLLVLLAPISYKDSWQRVSDNADNIFGCCSLVITGNVFDYTSARYYFGENRVRYYNKNNPEEDFSKWVVVGNENKIKNLDVLRDYPQALIVDDTCDWSWLGLDLEQIRDFGDLKVCKILK